MSNTTSEMRQSGMTFRRMPQGTIIVLLIIALAIVAAAVAVTANRRQAVVSNQAASAAIAPVSEAERFNEDWYKWYLANQRVAVVIPPTGTSFIYQPQQLTEMAAELGGASGLAVPSEAERFNEDWYKWYLANQRAAVVIPPTGTSFIYQPQQLNEMAAELGGATELAIPSEAERFLPVWREMQRLRQPKAELGTTLDFDYAAPYLNRIPAESSGAYFTEQYWNMAAEHAQLEQASPGDWAYYTERYWQRRH